jgi:tRNA 2-thiouridine synthesizing protein E
MYPAASDRACGQRPLSALERDEEGFLLDASLWHPGLIDEFAAEAGLSLNAERREIIRYIRCYFGRCRRVPEGRALLSQMCTIWGEERAGCRYLYRLFPRGYGQQACKIAGMRKPRRPMLDV